jgi:hypothetical protein
MNTPLALYGQVAIVQASYEGFSSETSTLYGKFTDLTAETEL